MFAFAIGLLAALPVALCGDEQPFFSTEAVFPPHPKHNHAPCLVELENGDLLIAWYRGSGERKADDVEVLGSRLKKGTDSWEAPFSMADTPGYPDCNPALFAAPDGSVWIWWPTILDHRWEGALLKFRRAESGGETGAPRWTKEGVLHITPKDFDAHMEKHKGILSGLPIKIDETLFGEMTRRSKDELYQRLGWMPRVHPTVLQSGRWLLPLYSDTFSCSLIAISDDRGKTWTTSDPIIGFGNIQPSIVRKSDGTLVAFMRENGPWRRIRLSRSNDNGQTWSDVTESALPNPGAGIEAIRLANGNWVIIYNDTTRGRHSLAVSLSEDEGATWPITRHLERVEPEQGAFHYPSITQARDGSIHAAYTKRDASGATMQHARFNEAWIRRGDPDPAGGPPARE
jgi:predicted neuraminidase